MDKDADLKFRQAARRTTEETVKAILLDYGPTQDLKVSDVLFIARTAGRAAFDAFTKPE